MRASTILLREQQKGNTPIIIARHGEAEKNQDKIINGKQVPVVGGRAFDSPLIECHRTLDPPRLGQRWYLLRELGLIKPEALAVAVSPAVRTRETWDIASRVAGLQDILPAFDPNLLELDEDIVAGQPKDREVILPNGSPWKFVPYHMREMNDISSGESYDQATERTMLGLHDLAILVPEGGTGLVVAHGLVPIRLAALALTGDRRTLEPKQSYCAEAAFSVTPEGQWNALYIGLPTDELDAPVSRAIWANPAVANHNR